VSGASCRGLALSSGATMSLRIAMKRSLGDQAGIASTPTAKRARGAGPDVTPGSGFAAGAGPRPAGAGGAQRRLHQTDPATDSEDLVDGLSFTSTASGAKAKKQRVRATHTCHTCARARGWCAAPCRASLTS